MKYMVLLYAEPAALPEPGTPEFETMMNDLMTVEHRMAHRATMLAGEGLLGPEAATTIRRRNGNVEMVDGPFAETREHLGGFYLIEAASLDDALAFAQANPMADYGSVEVRPVEVFE